MSCLEFRNDPQIIVLNVNYYFCFQPNFHPNVMTLLALNGSVRACLIDISYSGSIVRQQIIPNI